MAPSPLLPPSAPVPPSLLDHVIKAMHVTTLLCTLQQHERGYAMESRTIADWNFIYVVRGRVVWVVDGVEHPLEPYGLVLVPPGVVHHAYCRTPQVTLGSLHVLATLPGGQDVFRLLAPPRQRVIAAGSRFDAYFRGFINEFTRATRAEREQMFPGWAHLITREMLRDCAAQGLLAPRASDPLVAGVLEDLDRHLARPLALADLARRAGFSPQHLNKLFRRTLGTTPLKYLAHARMERAASLLGDSALTLAEVARRVGMRDPYYFSRQFSQHFGISPSAWRLRAASENPS